MLDDITMIKFIDKRLKSIKGVESEFRKKDKKIVELHKKLNERDKVIDYYCKLVCNIDKRIKKSLAPNTGSGKG